MPVKQFETSDLLRELPILFRNLDRAPRNAADGMLSDLDPYTEFYTEADMAGVEFDLGRANGRYFVNVFSSGLFTDVSQKTPTLLKNTFGKLAYYVSGLGELPNFRNMQLRVESAGKTVFAGSALMLFVFNGQTAGSLKIAYLSDIHDGLLDMLIVKGDNIVEGLRTAAGYIRPSSGHYPKDIVHLRSSELTIHSMNGESTDMDGEAGPGFPVRIECEPCGLKVLRPKPEVRKKRILARPGPKR